MKFEVIPVLSTMEELYQKPRSIERFQEYISKLQGNTKGDLELPIGGFNPMAKEHILQKIGELKRLNAEDLITVAIESLNQKYKNQDETTIRIVLNLADDLKGAWTNHHTTDFDSKFKINALVTRNFCTPYFWTSENYTELQIKRRVLEYVYRTIYWKNNPKPKTLEDCLNQEIYVSSKIGTIFSSKDNIKCESIKMFYDKYKTKEDYSLLFNFFYGDFASASLNFPLYGIKETTGFEFAETIAKEMKRQP